MSVFCSLDEEHLAGADDADGTVRAGVSGGRPKSRNRCHHDEKCQTFYPITSRQEHVSAFERVSGWTVSSFASHSTPARMTTPSGRQDVRPAVATTKAKKMILQTPCGGYFSSIRHRTRATSILQIFAAEGLRKPVPKDVRIVPSGRRTVDVDCTLQNQAVSPVMLPSQLARM